MVDGVIVLCTQLGSKTLYYCDECSMLFANGVAKIGFKNHICYRSFESCSNISTLMEGQTEISTVSAFSSAQVPNVHLTKRKCSSLLASYFAKWE